jgi:hypothetical protein
MNDENSIIDKTLKEMAVKLSQGVNAFEEIGKLYVDNIVNKQAIALAVQALQALKPVEPLVENPPAPVELQPLPDDADLLPPGDNKVKTARSRKRA